MDRKKHRAAIEFDLLKEMMDNRNKAAAMRALADNAHGEARGLYLRIAESFSYSAELLEQLKRALKTSD